MYIQIWQLHAANRRRKVLNIESRLGILGGGGKGRGVQNFSWL